MRILMAHNFYQQAGGEDQSFAAEISLLESYGHTVYPYTVHNNIINEMSNLDVAKRTFWNQESYREIRDLIRKEEIEIAHFQNTFPLISPSAYYAAQAEGVAVVQSIRNYRLFCANALFFRDGKVCEQCMKKTIAWPAIHHACYRDSRLGSSVLVGMNLTHRLIGTWRNAINRYITLTEFGRNKLIEGGIPKELICVKPNFVIPDPGMGHAPKDYALFVGRLTEEKGIHTLLKAWEEQPFEMALKIVGDGPLKKEVLEASETNPSIQYLGQIPNQNILELMKNAYVLVFPSQWYEGFPRVIVEAFAVGLPVISSNLGSMSTIVTHGKTGLHFMAGNSEDLVVQLRNIRANVDLYKVMRMNARQDYETKYTIENNYQQLMRIYSDALEHKKSRQNKI